MTASITGSTISPESTKPTSLTHELNRDCLCVTADPAALRQALSTELHDTILATRPHLFASTAVFVRHAQAERMRAIIEAVETAIALPAYREHVLAWAPAIARHDLRTRGAFMGYDFHLGPAGPQLIEINTNAGGAFLNAVLARAQRACCDEVRAIMSAPETPSALETTFLNMFLSEWQLERGSQPLHGVAIVDDDPAAQYLYPEFLLAQRVFRRHGLEAVIADPSMLALRQDRLWYEDLRIDLVYNRLTDFSLNEERHAALRAALLTGAAVVTPHPRAHALYADKRNLVALSDEALLRSWGLAEPVVSTLISGIPRTVPVSAANADALWARRDDLFFKPAAGFGARAAYRGDKLTKRVWAQIGNGQYVAQDRIAPSERHLRRDGAATALKLDIRNYVYRGEVQLLAARLYQGQTTNFRTPGGGFAPVFITPEQSP